MTSSDAELIARLRGVWRYKDLHLCPEAADRIEALEAKLAENEVRLGKAVVALEEISEYDTGATAGLAYTAKHHLAELKGESHE